LTRTQTTPVQTAQRPPGGPCPGDYYRKPLAIKDGSLSRASSLAATTGRYVGVERTLFFQRQHWQRRTISALPMVGQMIYCLAFGTLGGAGQGTLDPTYERTHTEQIQYSTFVQAVQALGRSHPNPLKGMGILAPLFKSPHQAPDLAITIAASSQSDQIGLHPRERGCCP
jgi:hypothetical protein